MRRSEMPRWRELTKRQRQFFDWVDLQDGETMADWWETWCDACAEDRTSPLDLEVTLASKASR